MVSNVGLNANASFARKAINYLNNEPLVEKGFSIIGEAKSTASGLPLNVGFTEGGRVLGYRKKLFRGKDKAAGPGVLTGLKDLGKKLTAQTGNLEKIGWQDFLSTDFIKKGSKNFDVLNKVANPEKYAAKVAEEGVKKGFFGTIKNGIGKVTKPIGKFVSESNVCKFLKIDKFANFCKKGHAGIIAVIDGGMETITEVIPAFKNGGVKEGFKQLGKSAAKVAAGTLGFVAGEAGGRAIGAAVGGAIGSAIPVVGTAVGAWVGGLLGGLFGGIFVSNVAGNLSKKVTGKPYSEVHAEAAKQQQALEVSQDANTVNELKQAVSEKLIEKQQSGQKLTKDDIEMAQSLGAAATNGAVPFGSLTAQTSQVPTAGQTQSAGPISIDPSIYAVPQEIRAKSEYNFQQTAKEQLPQLNQQLVQQVA